MALACANGVTFTWDNSGNPLNDATNACDHDAANRPTSFASYALNASFGYSDLGRCLQRSMDGQTTNNALDINTEAAHVLNDGTNSCLHGLDRLARRSVANEYFLIDAQ